MTSSFGLNPNAKQDKWSAAVQLETDTAYFVFSELFHLIFKHMSIFSMSKPTTFNNVFYN